MNNETKAVDVLADVIAAIESEGIVERFPVSADAVREIHTAVVELIEAHESLLDYVLSEAEARDYNPPADTLIIADSMDALYRIVAPK